MKKRLWMLCLAVVIMIAAGPTALADEETEQAARILPEAENNVITLTENVTIDTAEELETLISEIGTNTLELNEYALTVPGGLDDSAYSELNDAINQTDNAYLVAFTEENGQRVYSVSDIYWDSGYNVYMAGYPTVITDNADSDTASHIILT